MVDVDREIVAIDAELHSDLEALCLENGSLQNSLWGINYYPEMEGSIPVNLITDLLGKKGRYKENVEEFKFEVHPHLDVLADYMTQRIQQ